MPVYEYDGKHYELPDGLSNEQAIATIEDHLGASAQPTDTGESPLLRGWGVGMRGLIRGASTPMNWAADGVAGGFNALSGAVGSDVRMPYLSEVQKEGLDNRRLDGQPVYPEAVTPFEKAVQGGTEAISSGVALGGLVRGLLPSTPGQILSTTAGGAVAPVAHDKAKDVTGSPLAATAFSLLSSMAAGKAGGAVGGAVDRGLRGSAPALTMEEVEQRARASYRVVEESGATVRPLSARNMVDQIEAELRRNGYRPNNQPQVAAALQTMRDDFGQARVSFYQLDEARKAASALRSSNEPNIQRLGATLIREFDNQVASIQQRDLMPGSSRTDFRAALDAVESARNDWRALSKASMLEDVLNVAELKAAKPSASESELIRDGFLRIAQNKKLMNQFTAEERAAIIEVTRGIPMDKTLGVLAKLNPARSNFMLGVEGGGAFGALAAGKPGYAAAAAAIGAGGYGADKLQSLLRKRQAEGVVSGILSGRPQVSPDDMAVMRGLFGGAVNLQDR